MKTFLIIIGIIVAIVILILWLSPWGKRQFFYISKGRQLRLNNALIKVSAKNLQDSIMNLDYVNSITLMPYNDYEVCRQGVEFYIQVGVSDEKYIKELTDRITCPEDGKWQGFEVKVIIQSIAEAQEISKKYS